MPLNLISDSWIPVIQNGVAVTIRPDQIAEKGVERLDWPRPDLNLACYELLIGITYLAFPPEDEEDWSTRIADPEKLRNAFAPLTYAFNLTGQKPLFMQDFEHLDTKEVPCDRLFLDSSGENSLKKNSDLMVKRDRYTDLSLPLAAMALYTLQDFAPEGGVGHRTSLRGGGPLVALVMPNIQDSPTPLWDIIWANIPYGKPIPPEKLPEHLPWLKPTFTSENERIKLPPDMKAVPPENFFGMPRRVELICNEAGDRITAFRQKNYGINYSGWVHPLTSYYLNPKTMEKLPGHPKSGMFCYRDWQGILIGKEGASVPSCIHTYRVRNDNSEENVLVGGWKMKTMTPVDFLWSQQPLFPFSENQEILASDFISAAASMAEALKFSLKLAQREDAIQKAFDDFFLRTEPDFRSLLRDMIHSKDKDDGPNFARRWLAIISRTALTLYDEICQPLVLTSDITPKDNDKKFGISVSNIVKGRSKLIFQSLGYPPLGKSVFDFLNIPLPEKKGKEQNHDR